MRGSLASRKGFQSTRALDASNLLPNKEEGSKCPDARHLDPQGHTTFVKQVTPEQRTTLEGIGRGKKK